MNNINNKNSIVTLGQTTTLTLGYPGAGVEGRTPVGRCGPSRTQKQ